LQKLYSIITSNRSDQDRIQGSKRHRIPDPGSATLTVFVPGMTKVAMSLQDPEKDQSGYTILLLPLNLPKAVRVLQGQQNISFMKKKSVCQGWKIPPKGLWNDPTTEAGWKWLLPFWG